MKTFEHKCRVEGLTRFDEFDIVGVASCPHASNCEHRYDNFVDVCNGYQVLVNYGPINSKIKRECPCAETDRRHIEIKEWIR